MAYGDLKVNNLIYDTGSGDASRSVVSIPLLASPTFTGTPAAPTAAANTSTTQIATTAFVMTELGDYLLTATAASTYAPLAAPAFTGTATGVNLTLSGNLTVNGTTTTIDTTTLDVEDKNITLGKVSTPSDTTADGGGITLKGTTDKTIIWSNTTDYWTFNKSLEVTTGIAKITAPEADTARILMYADEGDDNADKWRLQADTSGNFTVANYSTGSWVDSITVSGSGNITGVGTVSDHDGDLRNIPLAQKTSAYVLVAADAGRAVHITTGGVTVNNSVFSAGNAVTIINDSGSDQTITQGSGVTIYNSADASTGNRTLAGRGMATIWFNSASKAYISGAGLS
tara:strand:+ start:449 stop:1474 length:1026 start_codon:yes stop_codon:yes gene_type:complete